MIETLGIVDIRKMNGFISEAFGINLADYASTILKRRYVHMLNTYNCMSVDNFEDRIKKGIVTADDVMFEVSLETTELFRDPSAWRELRDKYLPEVCKSGKCNILMPGESSGDELYTMMIVLSEANLLDKVQVDACCPSNRNLKQIKDGGLYDSKKLELGDANYTRYAGPKTLADYYTLVDNRAKMRASLLDGVNLSVRDILKNNDTKRYKMIVYRNVLLQYSVPLYERVVKVLVDKLDVGGYLIIGDMETLEYCDSNRKLVLVDSAEQVYRKKMD